MAIHLIYARSANGVIGYENSMPWNLPEDLAHFRHLTHGQPVVMGRKTWDSLPPRFRPLPGRTNIVVTRDSEWSALGALRANSLNTALELGARHGDTIWVIGGAQIYAQALPLADMVEVTVIHQDFAGDAFAPTLNTDDWHETHREDHVSSTGLAFSFVRYQRER